jgi:hypothetical protein
MVQCQTFVTMVLNVPFVDKSVPGRYSVSLGKSFPTFRKILAPSSSGSSCENFIVSQPSGFIKGGGVVRRIERQMASQ